MLKEASVNCWEVFLVLEKLNNWRIQIQKTGGPTDPETALDTGLSWLKIG